MRFIASTVMLLLLGSLSSCVTFAPPPPMLTYGGPETTPKNCSETAIAVGTGAALFDRAHTGAQGWFGRYKYGISEKIDLGIDLMGAKRNEGLLLSTKITSRYQLSKHSRLELGIGVADDSAGKSLNGDVAITFGTVRDKSWNFYTSLRLGYAKGVASNFVVLPGQDRLNDSIPPPNTTIALINLGAEGKISKHQKFILEGGYGRIFPKGEISGPAFYLSVGMAFIIGEPEEE